MRIRYLLFLGLCACDDGSAPEADSGAHDARVIVDVALPDADPPPADGTVDGTLDAAVDAGPDAAPLEIDDCSEVCGRYAECLAVDIFPTDEACLDACARASRGAPPVEWFACLDETGCDVIEECGVPPPIPLTCEAACAAIDACGLGPAYADGCLGWCAASPALVECAEPLAGDACEGNAFRQCVAERVLPLCGPYCAGTVECNVERAESCVTDCVARLRGADGLARARLERASACVAQSTQCLQTQRCADLDTPSGLGRTCQQACDGLQACELPPDPASCLADCEAQLELDPVGYQFFVDCVVEFVAPAECAPEVLESCFNLDPAFGPAPCDLYCEALGACTEDAPPDCVNACGAALLDPAAARDWRRSLPCGRRASCPDFLACLAAEDPAGLCPGVCADLAACGDVADCAERCVDDFDSARVQAWVGCLEGGACDGVGECLPGPPLPCADYCERLRACTPGAVPPTCEAACDDDAVRAPAVAADRVACVVAAPVCQSANPFEPTHAVDQCTLNPQAGGDRARACLNRCRHQVECLGEGELGPCAQACRAGLRGEAALRFAAEEACWAARPSAPTCAALAECPVDEVAVDCPAFCGAVAACSVVAEGCLDTCLAAPDLDVVACTLFADSCHTVADCVGFEVPEPTPECAALCGAQSRCDPAFDPLPCQLGCDPAAPLAAQAECAAVTACGALAVCLGIDAVDPACVEACGDCAACPAVCTGRQASPRADPDALNTAPACLAADACADIAACFPVPTACTDACDLLANCAIPFADDPVACRAVNCPGGQPTDLFRPAIACAERHLRAGCNEDAYLPCLIGIELPPQ